MQKELKAGTGDHWEKLAASAIEHLQRYDNQQQTYYAYYLNDPDGPKVLADALRKANSSFLYVPIVEGKTHA